MKVVLFCGGLGTRLREHSDTIPKPLVNIGYRPIVWHLMRYYPTSATRNSFCVSAIEAISSKITSYTYDEAISNDFTLSQGGRHIDYHSTDIEDWTITFVETGLHANIGQRLVAVREYLGDDEVFLANYSDGLSDVPLNDMIDRFLLRDAIGSFIAVRTWQSFHAVSFDSEHYVQRVGAVSASDFWINGGFFIFRREIFDYFEKGDELVEAPFRRLTAEKRLIAYPHQGFWRAMDTFKDKISFDRDYARGNAPWQVWLRAQDASSTPIDA